MTFDTQYIIEDYALQTQWHQLPEDVKERAIRCSIDLMGALILGCKGKQFDAGVRLSKSMGLYGDIPVIGSPDGFNLLGATISMSHASNSFDIDDGYNMIKGHPGTSFVAGVLSAALQENCTYQEYLTTLAVCYELTIRWGLVEQQHYQFLHSTGTYGAFGTAAGMGRLLHLDRKQLNNALSIADFHAPLTPVMRSVEYPSMNKDGVPFGALVGVMSVLETLSGESGRGHLLEMPEYAGYVSSLGKHYYIRELYFKPYTCCRWAHQPILACQTLMKEHSFTHQEIEKVTVNTFQAAAKLSKKIPANTDEAQYNIAYPVAASLVYGDLGFDQIKDSALEDERVLSMMGRLEFHVDPDMEKEFPQKRLAWVKIQLKDGTSYASQVYAAPGEHTDPELSFQWITDKFRRVTAPILSREGRDEMLCLLGTQSDIPMRTIISKLNEYL